MTKEDIEKEYIKNKRLIYYVANKFRGRDEMEDLISVATISFLNGLHDYENSTKECKQCTFLVKCMHNGLLKHVEKLNRKKRKGNVTSLNNSIADNLELKDVLASRENYEDEIIYKLALKQALTEIELEILQRIYRGELHSEIKKALGLKQSVLNIYIKNIKEKIKKL